MKVKWIIVLVIIYFVYLLIGAGIFIAIERPREIQACEDTLTSLEIIRSNITAGNNVFTVDDLTNIIQIVRGATSNGVVFDSDSNPSCASNWEFNKAFLFAGTIVTTIGYGHISPQTSGGQIFCIFYAMFGIPLFGVLMLGLGGKLAKCIKRIEKKLENKISSDRKRHWILILTTTIATVIFFSVIPAIIFSVIEQWNYREAYYFTFITLTTVGFGDFVAGQNPDLSYNVVYRVGIFFWLILGLACMATVLSQLTDQAQSAGATIIREKRKNSVEDNRGSSDEAVADHEMNAGSNPP